MSNPFELRLQLFQEAKDYLVAVFDQEVLEWDRVNTEKLDIENKFIEEKERYYELKGQDLGDIEKYPIAPDPIKLPEYPKYPTREEILKMATFIREFTADKGEEE